MISKRKHRSLGFLLSLSMMVFIFLIPFPKGRAEALVPRFHDEVGLLTESQAINLNNLLDEISTGLQFDVVVAVLPRLDYKEARLYAADWYEDMGFGYGSNLDGAILLLATEKRDYGFASLGYGLEVFTPAGQDYLETLFLPFLQEDDYYSAFNSFAKGVEDFVMKARSGAAYDSINTPLAKAQRRQYQLYGSGASVLLSLLIAFGVAGGHKRQLKSVRQETMAEAYLRENSLALTKQQDIFLHRYVQKIRRETKSSSGGGKSGSFTTSSGRSATGRSSKY